MRSHRNKRVQSLSGPGLVQLFQSFRSSSTASEFQNCHHQHRHRYCVPHAPPETKEVSTVDGAKKVPETKVFQNFRAAQNINCHFVVTLFGAAIRLPDIYAATAMPKVTVVPPGTKDIVPPHVPAKARSSTKTKQAPETTVLQSFQLRGHIFNFTESTSIGPSEKSNTHSWPGPSGRIVELAPCSNDIWLDG